MNTFFAFVLVVLKAASMTFAQKSTICWAHSSPMTLKCWPHSCWYDVLIRHSSPHLFWSSFSLIFGCCLLIDKLCWVLSLEQIHIAILVSTWKKS